MTLQLHWVVQLQRARHNTAAHGDLTNVFNEVTRRVGYAVPVLFAGPQISAFVVVSMQAMTSF